MKGQGTPARLTVLRNDGHRKIWEQDILLVKKSPGCLGTETRLPKLVLESKVAPFGFTAKLEVDFPPPVGSFVSVLSRLQDMPSGGATIIWPEIMLIIEQENAPNLLSRYLLPPRPRDNADG